MAVRAEDDAVDAEDLCAKSDVDVIIGNHRNLAVTQREFDGLANQMLVAYVFRMDHHSDVAQHGFRAGGGDCQ